MPCRYIEKLDLQNKLAAVFTSGARMIWASELWFSAGQDWREASGERWAEYVLPDDVEPMREWLADGVEGRHWFRSLIPATGRIARVWQHKFRIACPKCGAADCRKVDGHWLVIAATSDTSTPFLPAPPCLVGSHDLDCAQPDRSDKWGGATR
jgi:hypothetical protein